MKSYTQELVNPELPGVIMMSHGPFAVALVDTAKMILGEIENFAALSLEPGDDLTEFRGAFAKAYEAFPEGSVVVVDLYAGTPCNQALQYAQESGKVLNLITGLNFPMILSLLTTREDMVGQELVQETVNEGKNGIREVDVAGFIADDDDEDDE